MLLTRILTAVVGIPIIFTCIYFGSLPFYIFMFAVMFFCVQEFLTICKKYKPYFVVTLIMASVFFISLNYCKTEVFNIITVSAILMLLVLFALEIFGENTELSVQRISVSFLGAFFLPLALSHMVYIRDLNGGMQLMYFIFIVVWILDTAAYAFGRMLGKNKLAKNVSPKKTIEGAVAGLIFGTAAAVACRYIFMTDIITAAQSFILGLAISVVGQFSDLAESLIKRDGNIKDSGKIIPGHGGMFDRFDSYIFVAPVCYCLLQIFNRG